VVCLIFYVSCNSLGPQQQQPQQQLTATAAVAVPPVTYNYGTSSIIKYHNSASSFHNSSPSFHNSSPSTSSVPPLQRIDGGTGSVASNTIVRGDNLSHNALSLYPPAAHGLVDGNSSSMTSAAWIRNNYQEVWERQCSSSLTDDIFRFILWEIDSINLNILS